MSEESFEKLKNEMSDTRNEMRTVTAIMGEEFARLHAEIREVDKSVEKNNKDMLTMILPFVIEQLIPN